MRIRKRLHQVTLPILTTALLVVFTGCKSSNTASVTPIISFGVIADTQYADKDTRGKRHYREALVKLKESVADLNKRELAFTIQLGDIIDGNASDAKTEADVDNVMREYNKLSMPLYHVVGNHCLEAGKETLHKELKLESFYYDFVRPEAPGWRFVVLDGNDGGYGVLGDEQLSWLNQKLATAQKAHERVILFNHYPLLKEVGSHRMRKPGPVLELIGKHDCVVAYFAGHSHGGGYIQRNGVHHVTVKGMVEAPVENAYAIIDVFENRLVKTGFGKEPSREMAIPAIGK